MFRIKYPNGTLSKWSFFLGWILYTPATNIIVTRSIVWVKAG